MKKKLLVIEDENSVAKQLRWGLDKEYEITIASDAKQAKPPERFPVQHDQHFADYGQTLCASETRQ